MTVRKLFQFFNRFFCRERPSSIGVMFAVLLLAGCVVQPVYYQDGLAKEATDAQVVLILGERNGNVVVQTLDGKELADPYTTWNGGYSAVRELRLSSGIHTLVGTVWANGVTHRFEIAENFEAGGRYKISPLVHGYSLSAQIQRIDSGAQK